jgi:acetone carboxylase gamma subunit
MSTYTKKEVRQLVDGSLVWETVHQMLSMPKDDDRYKLYMEVLQDAVSYDDKILLAVGPHLNVVESATDGEIIYKCDCGHDFGDYRNNWKLGANIYVRDTPEKMDQVYPRLMSPDTTWQVYREYSCPTCGTMLDIEAPTPWYPCMHDFQPDLKTFFEWVGLPAPAKI